MNKEFKKLPKGKDFWHRHIKNQMKSGMTKADYSKLYQLNYKTFCSHANKLDRAIKEDINAKKMNDALDDLFVPVSTSRSEAFTLKINSIEFKFDSCPSVSWLGQLIKELSSQDSFDAHF